MFLHNGRYQDLHYVIEGYKKTLVPLVMNDGKELLPYVTNGGDDIGSYLLIPKLAYWLNLTCDQAIYLFFYGIIFTSLFLGIAGFFLLYTSMRERIVAALGLIMAIHLMLKINDVYIIGACLSIAMLPLFLYLVKEKKDYLLSIFLLFSGIAIGFSNHVRAYSGIGVLLFFSIIIFFDATKIMRQKMLYYSLLIISMGAVSFYIHQQQTAYEQYAQKNFTMVPKNVGRHPFWHTFYVGFGFINCLNRPGIVWDDNYGYSQAKKINPSIKDNDYDAIDNILKYEILRLFTHDWFFAFSCLFAKLGVLLFFLLKYANIFFLALLYALEMRLFSFSTIIACTSLVGFNALYPLIAVPFPEYSISFIIAIILWGIISLNRCFNEKNMWNIRKKLSVKRMHEA